MPAYEISGVNIPCYYVSPSSLANDPSPRLRLPGDQNLARVHLPERSETFGGALKEFLEVCFHYLSGAVAVSGAQPLSHQGIRHRLFVRLGISEVWRQARRRGPHRQYMDIGQKAHIPQDRQQRPMSRQWRQFFSIDQAKERAPQVGGWLAPDQDDH